jgi:orotate phosphoribosyltransferase
MSKIDVLKQLAQIDAVITNSHIVYTSGKHGSAYVNKDAIYPHTELTSSLCLEIAEHFANANVDVVIAPAVGGVILSQWVAYHLTQLTKREVLGVYAEKSGDEFVIKRGYDKLCKGKRVLVVEDILTTGGSVKKVVEALGAIGVQIVGAAALCNRGEVSTRDVGNPPELFSLTNIKLDAWDAGECPMCREQTPINTDVGKGREFLSSLSV